LKKQKSVEQQEEISMNLRQLMIQFKEEMKEKQITDNNVIIAEKEKDIFSTTINNLNNILIDMFPEYIQDLPLKAIQIIVNWMELDRFNDWKLFATEIWPEFTIVDQEIYSKNGKMEKVLKVWGSQGAKTSQLFDILNKLNRKDILIQLEEHYPFISRYYIQKKEMSDSDDVIVNKGFTKINLLNSIETPVIPVELSERKIMEVEQKLRETEGKLQQIKVKLVIGLIGFSGFGGALLLYFKVKKFV